jgi:hypothetical protein
MYFGQN